MCVFVCVQSLTLRRRWRRWRQRRRRLSVQVRTEATDTSASSPPPSFDITFTVEYLPPLPLLHILPLSASSPSLILHPLSSLPSFIYFLHHHFFAHNHPLILCSPIFFISFFHSLPLSPSFSSPFSFYSRYYSIQISLCLLFTIFPLLLSSSGPGHGGSPPRGAGYVRA